MKKPESSALLVPYYLGSLRGALAPALARSAATAPSFFAPRALSPRARPQRNSIGGERFPKKSFPL